MLIFLYIFLLLVFFIHFTTDNSAAQLKKGDWIVLFTSPGALVFSLNHFVLGG